MNLTHDPADIVRYLLIAIGHGTLPTASGSWPINVMNEPDTPDDCITVYNTTGKVQGRIQKTGEFVEKPGIQVRIRAANYSTGYTKGKQIETSLDTDVLQDTVTIGSSQYRVHALSRTANLVWLGKDVTSSKRQVFTLNYTVTLWSL